MEIKEEQVVGANFGNVMATSFYEPSCEVGKVKIDNLTLLMKQENIHEGEDYSSINLVPEELNIKEELPVAEDYKTLQAYSKIHSTLDIIEEQYACHICEYRTGRITNMRRHMKTHTAEKPYACSICRFKTVHKQSLKCHVKMHTGEKPYACNDCAYRTADKSNFRRHMRTHTGEKRHACGVCEYRTAENHQLREHLMIHTGERPYTCNDCGYTTVRKETLKHHIKTHTRKKHYVRSVGDFKKTTLKPDLRDRMNGHAGKKPYACNFCGYGTNVKHNLKRHMKTHVLSILP